MLPLTFLDKKTAEAWLSLRQSELIENRWKPAVAREPEEVGFADYAERWLASRELSPKTHSEYRRILNGERLGYFNKFALNEIHPAMVKAWWNAQDPRYATARRTGEPGLSSTFVGVLEPYGERREGIGMDATAIQAAASVTAGELKFVGGIGPLLYKATAVGDELRWSVDVPGTREYSVELTHYRSPSYGKVQMLLDGHSAASVAERLGISHTNVLYRWKRQQLDDSGPVASSLDVRVRELEAELRRVERERDILKKALSIFSRGE